MVGQLANRQIAVEEEVLVELEEVASSLSGLATSLDSSGCLRLPMPFLPTISLHPRVSHLMNNELLSEDALLTPFVTDGDGDEILFP